MDSTLKVTELVTPKNKYTIFYYKIPVSFGSPNVHVSVNNIKMFIVAMEMHCCPLKNVCTSPNNNKY